MAADTISIAKKEMSRRRFRSAIEHLESRAEYYEDNAEYYILAGTACLYIGDFGAASQYFQRARQIKLTDINLLLGQAAIFLKRGDTERALHYYLEICEKDPENKIAKNAMEFIRLHGNYETICRWADSGKLEQFFPPLGVNPDKIFCVTLISIFFIAGCIFGFSFLAHNTKIYDGPRRDLTLLTLSADEKSNAQETDLSSQTIKYILSSKDITKSYENALNYFQKGEDNRCQIEINRILNSNASLPIKQKSRILMGYLSVPTFDSIGWSPSCSEVEKDPLLYLDCFVHWTGRVSDVHSDENIFECRFLVGYEDMKKIDTIVTLKFMPPPIIENDKPISVLAKISVEDGKVILEGKSVFQSVKLEM